MRLLTFHSYILKTSIKLLNFISFIFIHLWFTYYFISFLYEFLNEVLIFFSFKKSVNLLWSRFNFLRRKRKSLYWWKPGTTRLKSQSKSSTTPIFTILSQFCHNFATLWLVNSKIIDPHGPNVLFPPLTTRHVTKLWQSYGNWSGARLI